MLMCISLFTPCVFSECLSAGMEGTKTSNNSMQQLDNGNHSSGNAHLLIIILIEECLMFLQFLHFEILNCLKLFIDYFS